MSKPDRRPILCATDFSPNAQQAASIAAAFAKRLEVELVLAHCVIERPALAKQLPERSGRLRLRLAEEAARLRTLGARVSERLLAGSAESEIVRSAEECAARYLLLGASGSGALGRWVLGSVAERVAESARCSTIVLRETAPFEAWLRGERELNVFVGMDFSEHSDAALKWIADLREIGACAVTAGFVDRHPGSGAEIAIPDALGLLTEAGEELALMEDDLRARARRIAGEEGIDVRISASMARVDAQILRLAAETRADLIVVGTHQWHGLQRVRHRSVSRRLLRDATVAVACVPGASGLKDAPHPHRIERVLVATDLSDHARHAIAHGYALVSDGGEVQLLHILAAGEASNTARASLQAAIPAAAESRAITSSVRVLEATDVAGVICESAEHLDADVICIGARGLTGIARAVLGSVAQAVLNRSTRPVLVVREPSRGNREAL